MRIATPVLKVIEAPIPCKILEAMRKKGDVAIAERKDESV
jgi:hypothetical protein